MVFCTTTFSLATEPHPIAWVVYVCSCIARLQTGKADLLPKWGGSSEPPEPPQPTGLNTQSFSQKNDIFVTSTHHNTHNMLQIPTLLFAAKYALLFSNHSDVWFAHNNHDGKGLGCGSCHCTALVTGKPQCVGGLRYSALAMHTLYLIQSSS